MPHCRRFLSLESCFFFFFFPLVTQLVNHGVSEKLIHDVLEVASEFFEMPAKDKESLYFEDSKQTCRVHTSIKYDREKVHYWRDNL
jgi:isopenicillin N synthase-like dioxygenase